MATEYRLLGMKVMRMIQNERKSSQLRDYLGKNINVQKIIMDDQFNQVDEQKLQTIQIKTIVNNGCQNKYVSDKKQLFLNKYNNQMNKKQQNNQNKKYQGVKYEQKDISGQNEFMYSIQFRQDNKPDQSSYNKQQNDEQNYKGYKRQVKLNSQGIEIDVKKERGQIICGGKEQIYYNQKQQNEQEDEYFQIMIRNENTKQVNQQQGYQNLHQVKIYKIRQNQQQQSHNNNNQMFNLSNFSSFNGIISNDNNIINTNNYQFNNIQEQTFYQKQFVYLIKKIQLTHHHKLSSQGIQSIANQLKSLFYQHCTNQQLQLFYQHCTNQQLQSSSNISNHSTNHIKDITSFKLNTNIKSQTNDNIKSSLNKQLKSENIHFITSQNKKNLQQHPNKNKKLNCDSNLSTKLKYQTNTISQTKPKSKNKYQLPIQLQKKYQLNKENHKIQHQTKKLEIKKQNDRSTSPLSYRVLMEKKKTQQQKSKQSQIKHSQTVKYKNQHTSSITLSNSSFIKKAHDMKILNPYQSQKKQNSSFLVSQQIQKKNKLKIILENCSQQKIKTFSFQYVNNDKNLHQTIQEYCLKNKINIKNIKLIQTALSHQKPIITIKQ